MSSTSKNNSLTKRIVRLFHKITSSNILGNQENKLLFTPDNEITIQPTKSNMSIDIEKHYHRPNAHPVPEKQSLLKEKKKESG